MAVRVEFSNLEEQLKVLQQGMSEGVRKKWESNSGEMIEAMGDELEDLVADVFKTKRSPDGIRWKDYAPLTREVYQATGQTADLGGTKMPQSFQIDGPGNLWRPRKWGFSFGSVLKAVTGYFVAKTFQMAFKIPRSAGDHEAAGRVRRWMAAMTGVPAPREGGQLTHPKRVILKWTQKWVDRILKVAEDFLAVSFRKANAETAKKVKAAQKMLDARRRTTG